MRKITVVGVWPGVRVLVAYNDLVQAGYVPDESIILMAKAQTESVEVIVEERPVLVRARRYGVHPYQCVVEEGEGDVEIDPQLELDAAIPISKIDVVTLIMARRSFLDVYDTTCPPGSMLPLSVDQRKLTVTNLPLECNLMVGYAEQLRSDGDELRSRIIFDRKLNRESVTICVARDREVIVRARKKGYVHFMHRIEPGTEDLTIASVWVRDNCL